jgi:hypothetical protein
MRAPSPSFVRFGRSLAYVLPLTATPPETRGKTASRRVQVPLGIRTRVPEVITTFYQMFVTLDPG